MTFERQTITYAVHGREDNLKVTVLEVTPAGQQLVGHGEVALHRDVMDGELHLFTVPLLQERNVAGEVALRLCLVHEEEPATAAPSISQWVLAHLHRMREDDLETLLESLGVHEEGCQQQKVFMLTRHFDQVEREHGKKMSLLAEAESSADVQDHFRLPSFASRSIARVRNWISSKTQHVMVPGTRGQYNNLHDLLLAWVKSRQEISGSLKETADFLHHQTKVVSGMTIIDSVVEMSAGGFQIASLICIIMPDTDLMTPIMTSVATGLGIGHVVTSIVTKQITKNQASNGQRVLFQMLAQESALHRQVYFAVHGRHFPDEEEDGEDGKDEDTKLSGLPAGGVDPMLKMAPAVICDTVAHSFLVASSGAKWGKSITNLVNTGKTILSEHPSGIGNIFGKMAEEFSHGGQDPETVVAAIMTDPIKNIGPPPGGVALFDVKTTARHVRMVFQTHNETKYFEASTPATLPNGRCQVFFQVLMHEWQDIYEWDVNSQAFKMPLTRQVYMLSRKEFRWFHLEGPYPIKVISVEDENGSVG